MTVFEYEPYIPHILPIVISIARDPLQPQPHTGSLALIDIVHVLMIKSAINSIRSVCGF